MAVKGLAMAYNVAVQIDCLNRSEYIGTQEIHPDKDITEEPQDKSAATPENGEENKTGTF